MQFQDFDLSEPLLRAVREKGFQKPTQVQEQTIPAAMEGRDVLGTAQTGTGKTVAFLLPSLKHMLKGKAPKNPRMVVLAPTRELAVQIAEEAEELSKHTHLRVLAVYGGTSIRTQSNDLRRGVDLIVATPGRLLDQMRRGNVSFKDLEIFVLDEADRMLDMGFIPDIDEIVQRMPEKRQTMLFSATMPQPIVSLTYKYLKNPLRVEIDTAVPPSAINQQIFPVPKHLKEELLIELLKRENVESALVFTRTKAEADVVTRKLREESMSVAVIHGDFHQKKRMSSLERFRKGNARILVATNVAARGLDISDITHVVNYDVPDEAENYVHRIGRTARLDKDGVAWTFVTPEDEPLISGIEYLLGREIERVTLPDFDYDVPAPSWAKPSAKTLLKRVERSQSKIDVWKSLTRK
ncbi:MAG: DEAD/DEAH box helicase [Anaerolineales bacterium]|nr:DEAD/DEAH box helicase [Anaerolineales bacterium]